ncbi:MAG: hypothetical protein ACP5HW_03600 [Candidatus Micrarchaeia archaeon]
MLLSATPLPFFEPDNYEYLLFVNLVLQRHNLSVSNPFLIYQRQGFFEHPGLYLLPSFFALLFHANAVLAMHAIYSIFLVLQDLLLLIIVYLILKDLSIERWKKYFVYGFVLLNPLLLPYNYPIEWRGTLFASVSELLLLLLFYLALGGSKKKKILAVVGGIIVSAYSIWMWSGGIAAPMAMAIALAFYFLYNKKPLLASRISLLIAGLFVVLPFFPQVVSIFTSPFGKGYDSNPMQIGELQSLSQTLTVFYVVFALFFVIIAIVLALMTNLYLSKKAQQFLFLLIWLLFAQIPLAIVYFRLISLVAPYLAILYALGIVLLFSFAKPREFIIFVLFAIILFASLMNYLQAYQIIFAEYRAYNPIGLYLAAQYLAQNYPNSTVFAFYGYGGVLEAYGHVRVYSDTVQELGYANLSLILCENASQAYSHLAQLKPKPQLLLASPQLLGYSIFQNCSKNSILLANRVAYLKQIYQKNNFSIYEVNED